MQVLSILQHVENAHAPRRNILQVRSLVPCLSPLVSAGSALCLHTSACTSRSSFHGTGT